MPPSKLLYVCFVSQVEMAALQWYQTSHSQTVTLGDPVPTLTFRISLERAASDLPRIRMPCFEAASTRPFSFCIFFTNFQII